MSRERLFHNLYHHHLCYLDTCIPVGMRKGSCIPTSARHTGRHIFWHIRISSFHIVAKGKRTNHCMLTLHISQNLHCLDLKISLDKMCNFMRSEAKEPVDLLKTLVTNQNRNLCSPRSGVFKKSDKMALHMYQACWNQRT